MDDFPLPQEANDIIDVRVVAQAEDVVIGDAGFLLGGQVFRQVGDRISFDGHGGGGPGRAGGSGGVDARGVIHKIGHKAAFFHLRVGQLPRELMYNGADHLQMAQLLGADVSQQALQLRVGHGVALAEIPQRGAKLTIRSSILQ